MLLQFQLQIFILRCPPFLSIQSLAIVEDKIQNFLKIILILFYKYIISFDYYT